MRQSRYLNDQWSVYKYGNRIKVVYFKCGRLSDAGGHFQPGKDSGSQSDERLRESLSRPRSTVYEWAACNDFEFFVTLTLDAAKRDRGDLAGYRKALAQFIRDLNRRREEGEKIRYLLVPEQHRDGSWHMHGLVKGLVVGRDLVRNEHGYLDWPAYRGKFGFISLDTIKNPAACCSYIAKYVTKSMRGDKSEKTPEIERGGHLFFCSQGLKRREVIARYLCGNVPVAEKDWDWENDYIKIKWFELGEGGEILKS